MGKKSNKPSQKKNRSGKFWSFIGKVILIIFIISIFLPILYRWVNPPITPLMIIRKVTIGAPIEHEWRDLSDISYYMVACAIASEDNNFLGHHGFDFGAIDRALTEREAGIRKRGASTISQQTAKNVFLWPKSSWIRKGCEVYFTFLIETFWSKERIMEVYLNVIEMGKGIYGAEAAAQHYFHHQAKSLTKREAALITACYPAPLHRNPANPSHKINQRAHSIMQLVPKLGKITFDDESIAKAQERYQKREAKRRAKKARR